MAVTMTGMQLKIRLGVCAAEERRALHIDAKRCIPTTYCGPDGLKTFCRADS